MGGYAVHHHADHIATQCCSLGNRDRALPFGGGNAVYAQMGIASHTGDAVLASISTSLAEILGGAIALEMLLDIPIVWGAF